MVYFPQRDENGEWAARKIFTKRIPSTVDFKIEGSEFDLYREVTEFVKRHSIRAAADGDNPRARAVGFLMALYQRRLASSTRAMRRSLANRADRLERGLAQAEDIARTAPPDLPSMDELDEMEERDRERLELLLDAITLAGNAEMVRQEITELRALAVKAENVEQAGVEAKLAKFEDLLRGQGFFDRPDQSLVLFTEFKDTLDYLVEKLEAWGFKVATIHGGMRPGARDELGTRLHAEQQFREGAVQVLVATEAAGEGTNLQVCNIIRHVGGHPGTVYGKNGKPFLRDRIGGYNNAAHHAPWIVLVDLDREGECAPSVREAWLRRPAPRMCFRVVRAIEAWLMADADRLAAFMGFARNKVPVAPERLDHPKQTMVNLARMSRRRDVRQDMVPRQGSGRSEGPAYTSRLIEYATDRWRPDVAALRAHSLRRAVACLQRLSSEGA